MIPYNNKTNIVLFKKKKKKIIHALQKCMRKSLGHLLSRINSIFLFINACKPYIILEA